MFDPNKEVRYTVHMARKRDYGSGSLRLRGDIYYYRFYDPHGNRQEGSTGKSDRKAAQTVLASKIAAANNKTEKFAQRVGSGVNTYAVGNMLDEYKAYRIEKKKGLGADEYIIEKALRPFFGSMPLRKLTTQATKEYRSWRKEQKGPARLDKDGKPLPRKRPVDSTIDRELRILKAALMRMWKEGNPLAPSELYVHLENEDNVRKGFIYEDNILGILTCIMPDSEHIRNLVPTLFYSGMRIGEALSVLRKDINLKGEAPMLLIRDTKNEDQREVPIWPQWMPYIEAQLRYCEAHSNKSPYLFTRGGVAMRSVKNSWKKLMRRAGHAELNPHDLRRSAARWMRDKGVPSQTIMAILGHHSLDMLIRYGIIDASDLRAAMNVVRAA